MQEEHEVPENPLYSGVCVGGPLNGQDASSRFPKGFLLCDRPGKKAWLYDYLPGDALGPTPGKFLIRIAEGVELIEDPAAPKNRWRAAEEAEFDVIAAPWIETPSVEVPQAVGEGEE